MEFKVGDRVLGITIGNTKIVGTGTVKAIQDITWGYGVEFDDPISGGHDLAQGIAGRSVRCKYGYGWWCKADMLAIVEEPKIEGEWVPAQGWKPEKPGRFYCFLTGLGANSKGYTAIHMITSTIKNPSFKWVWTQPLTDHIPDPPEPKPRFEVKSLLIGHKVVDNDKHEDVVFHDIYGGTPTSEKRAKAYAEWMNEANNKA